MMDALAALAAALQDDPLVSDTTRRAAAELHAALVEESLRAEREAAALQEYADGQRATKRARG